MDKDLEEIILEWNYGRRANGLRVSRKLIMVKAKHVYDERCPEVEQEYFKATEDWLQKFMLRHGLSLKGKTTTVQQEPHHLNDKLLDLRNNTSIGHRVWDDMAANTTVNRAGATSISLKTTGHQGNSVFICQS